MDINIDVSRPVSESALAWFPGPMMSLSVGLTVSGSVRVNPLLTVSGTVATHDHRVGTLHRAAPQGTG